MRQHSQIFIEAVVVGSIMVGADYAFKLAGYDPQPLKNFIIGVLFHVIFEYAGMNEKWCRLVFK